MSSFKERFTYFTNFKTVPLMMGPLLVFFSFVEEARSLDTLGYSREAVAHQIDEIFIPKGFDSNAPVTLLAHTDYDKSCEEIVSQDAIVSEEEKKIYLKSWKIQVNPENECSGDFESVFEEFKIGTLKRGVYQIVGSGKEPVIETLEVQESNLKDIDKFSYPQVLELRLGLRSDGTTSLYVDVHLNQSCERIKEIDLHRRDDNFWEIFPVIEKTSTHCLSGTFIQTQPIDLGEIPFGTHIFYIRTNDGESQFYFESLI